MSFLCICTILCNLLNEYNNHIKHSDLTNKYTIIGQLSNPLGTKMLVRCKVTGKTNIPGNATISVLSVNGVAQASPIQINAKYHHAIKETLLSSSENEIECYETGEFIGSPYLVRQPGTDISISREPYRFATYIIITKIMQKP